LCGCQPGAGSPCPGNTNYILCTFAFNITAGCPTFTAINAFTTSGTYAAADILNLKLYQTNFSTFNTSTLVATINTGLGPGAHSFTGFSLTPCAATQRYYWITADFAPAAVPGNTIQVNLITAAMYAITGTVNYGTNTAAGIQTICNPLPVSLISFAGKNENGKNILEWQTASETNNDYFTLERSDDGLLFSPVARVDGAGTVSQANSYSAIDDYAGHSAVTYYRLRQTDLNGAYEYVGGIVAVYAEPLRSEIIISVSPDNLSVRQQEGDLDYVIYDLAGRNCLTGTIQQGETAINLDGLPDGTYILRLSDKAHTTKLFSKVSE
ncbi:MAG TPA: T9SS type A sorting domain-containing protein, partial [Bacteroidia bacterium]|nr:T9SS type A sorting domain-containing protein [Bacteroidia bacterium]